MEIAEYSSKAEGACAYMYLTPRLRRHYFLNVLSVRVGMIDFGACKGFMKISPIGSQTRQAAKCEGAPGFAKPYRFKLTLIACSI